ncbi:MAG: thioredoxin family protein [Pseudomonadota bacterium]
MPNARMFPFVIRHFAAWLCALGAIALFIAPAHAQTDGPTIPTEARYGDENIAAVLYADGLPKPGEEWMLALRFTPKGEEWHGYWSNPGDAGLGMQVQLDLPEGWELGEALYPVPDRLLIGDLMNHIYEGQYAVLIPVRVPEDAEVSGVTGMRGFADYLACTDEVCVPQDAVLAARQGGDFAQWRAQVAPLLSAAASFEVSSGNLRLAIPLPENIDLPDPHVFIANARLVDYPPHQTLRRSADTLTATIPVAEYGGERPSIVSGIVSFGGSAGVAFTAMPGDVPVGGEMLVNMNSVEGVTPPLWTLVLGALVGGLLLNVMPCVFPILSLKAIALVRAGGSETEARIEGVAYTAGVVLACIALGGTMLALRAAGEQVGWAFQLQNPGVVVVLLVLAAIITANFGGIFELPSLGSSSGPRKGAMGAFATGLLAAFAATPCTGPFMAAAMGAALLLPVSEALLLFALLGLGLALPFLAIGFVPTLRRILPKPGAWMETFRRIMSIPMGLTTLALIWLVTQIGGRWFALIALILVLGVVVALWIVGKLQKAGKMAWPAFGLVAAPFVVFAAIALPASFAAPSAQIAQSILEPRIFSQDELAEARSSGKPVFLWFTADWCVTCKINENVAIEREATAKAFAEAGVIPMVGDWTVRDEAITMFLTEQGAAGVPLYLWYEPGAEAEQLPQVLTPDMLTERASRGR